MRYDLLLQFSLVLTSRIGYNFGSIFGEVNRVSKNSFGGNVSNVQIQQDTRNSSQSIVNNSENVDFEKVRELFSQIRNNIDSLGVSNVEQEKIIGILNEVQTNVDLMTEPGLVRQALSTVRDFLIGVSGSLAASGILHLMSTL